MSSQIMQQEYHLCEWLVNNGSDNPVIQYFVENFLRPTHFKRKNGKVELTKVGFELSHIPALLLHVPVPKTKLVDDPFPFLNLHAREAVLTGRTDFMLESPEVIGFSDCMGGFHQAFSWSFKKGKLLSPDIEYPKHLVVQTPEGSYWTRRPETGLERLYFFLFFVRAFLAHLAAEPVIKKDAPSVTSLAHMMTQLPKRACFVRAGDDIAVIYTHDTPDALQGQALAARWEIVEQQSKKYSRPRSEVETAAMPGMQPPQAPPAWEEIQQW